MSKRNRKNRKDKADVDKDALYFITSPNVWTKNDEDKWLKQPAKALEMVFKPGGKPRHVKLIAKNRCYV